MRGVGSLVPLVLCLLAAAPPSRAAPTVPVSEASEECLSCHGLFSPGIVSDWRSGRHASSSLRASMAKPARERRVSLVSTRGIVDSLQGHVAVGCAECHTLDPELHKDTFPHNGYRVHVVVTPSDCAHCHPAEREEFQTRNKMAHAYGNLHDNPLFQQLERSSIGVQELRDGRLVQGTPDAHTRMDTCYGCHGTELNVLGMKQVETPMEKMEVPALSGWPNSGVGRVNPDGSLGSCSACHPRHAFSIALARQPQVCGRCHREPDVPAWNVYEESRHGILYAAGKQAWNLEAVPWTLGQDFASPTCAACHASLVVDPEGAEIVPRTHGYTDRLWVRLFGLVYSHPQPRNPDTRKIRNEDGLPLPVSYAGTPASRFLIDGAEQQDRRRTMRSLCHGCHSTEWVDAHFRKMDGTLAQVDRSVGTATRLVRKVWASGANLGDNPFDGFVEMLWTEQWLFHANAIRYASAMGASPEQAAFHDGWWRLQRGLREMQSVMAGPHAGGKAR